jgi:hypothetical protein
MVIQIAFSIAYVYVIMDSGEEVFGFERAHVGLLFLPFAVVLGAIKDLRKLWIVSIFGLVVVVGLLLGGIISQGIMEKRTLSPPRGKADVDLSFVACVGWLGSFLYSVEAVNHVMPNAATLERPADMQEILFGSMVFLFFVLGGWELYASSAGFGHCPDLDRKADSVLKCMTPGALAETAKVAVGLNCAFSFPLSLFPASQMLEGIVVSIVQVGQRSSAEAEGSSRRGFLSMLILVILRPALCVAVVACALVVSGLDHFTGLVGSTVMSILGFLVPVLLYEAALRLEPARSAGLRYVTIAWHTLLMVAALILASVTTLSYLGINLP